MNKNSIGNMVNKFYSGNPDTIIVGIYYLFDNKFAIDYRCLGEGKDGQEYRTTLRDDTEIGENKND